MLKFVVFASALLLAGCTDDDWSNLMSYPAPGAGEYPAPRTGETPATAFPPGDRGPARPAAENCSRVARDRSTDAAAQGFDDQVQQQVYAGSYADCIKWAQRAAR